MPDQSEEAQAPRSSSPRLTRSAADLRPRLHELVMEGMALESGLRRRVEKLGNLPSYVANADRAVLQQCEDEAMRAVDARLEGLPRQRSRGAWAKWDAEHCIEALGLIDEHAFDLPRIQGWMAACDAFVSAAFDSRDPLDQLQRGLVAGVPRMEAVSQEHGIVSHLPARHYPRSGGRTELRLSRSDQAPLAVLSALPRNSAPETTGNAGSGTLLLSVRSIRRLPMLAHGSGL
jgi:hypothetical protein